MDPGSARAETLTIFGVISKEKNATLRMKSEHLFRMRIEIITITFLVTNYWTCLYNFI